MLKIQVLGEGCADCNKLYENTLQAVKAEKLDATVEKVDDLLEIVRLGVLSAPALMVNGKLVAAGRVPSKKAIAALLKKEI